MRHADDDRPSIFIALGCGLAALVTLAAAIVLFMPNFIHAVNAGRLQPVVTLRQTVVNGTWTDRTTSSAGQPLDFDGSDMYVNVPDQGMPRRFSVTADMSLPENTGNQSTSYLFLGLDTYGQRGESDSKLPYLEVGIVRSGHLAFRPAVFYSIQKRQASGAYHPTSTMLTPGFHWFGVTVSDGTIVLSVDGKPVLREPESEMFAIQDHLYVQIDSVVSRVGDAAAGDVRNIEETTQHSSTPQPYAVTCIYANRGIAWYPGAKSYHAAGQFAAEGPSIWRTKGYNGCGPGR